MDSLKDQLKPFRGCLTFFGVILLIALFGGVMELTLPSLGGFAPVAAIGAVLLGILFWISLTKGARWAKLVAGVILLIAGLGVTIFTIYDFVTSLIQGKSILKTSAIDAGMYGQTMFILLMVGVGILGGGILLLGSLREKNKG